MTSARVHFPIKLTLDPSALQGDALAHTAGLVASNVRVYYVIAQQELRADGVIGTPKQRFGFDWKGDLRRTFSEAERRRIEKVIAAEIERLSRVLPGRAPAEDFTIQRYEFLTKFRGLLVLLGETQTALVDDLEQRYRDQLDDVVAGVVWVVTTYRAASWRHVYWAARDERDRELDDTSLFAYFWDATRVEELRKLDKKHLRRLPQLADQDTQAPADAAKRDWQVPADVHIVFMGAKLPELNVEDYLALGATVRLSYTFMDLLTQLPAAFDKLSTLFKLQSVFVELMDLYGDQPLPVLVWPFAVKRKIAAANVRMFVTEAARGEYQRAEQLGEFVVLTPTTEAQLPSEIVAPARGLGVKQQATPDALHPDQDWPPGVRGVHYAVVVNDAQMARRAGYAGQWLKLQAEAEHIVKILNLTNGFLSNDRYDAVWKWALQWETVRDPDLFDLLLLAVDRKGALGRLFDAWLEEGLYGVTLRPLIAMAIKTRYRRHPRLRNVIEKLEKYMGGFLLHEYDVDQQRIRLFGDSGDTILCAGDSTDPKRGVVAETSSYYSESSKVKRPNKAAMEKLSEPVKRKVGALMARLVCSGDETMTEDQIIAQAVKEASEELQLDPDKDFEPIKIRLSLRVIKLERKRVGGVEDVFVYYQHVQQFAGDTWQPAGDVKYGTALQFESELLHYHLQHLMKALTVLVLVEAIVLTGVFAVGAGIIGAGELIFAIIISDAMYLWTNRHEGYTLEGFLMATWMGELEMIGFKGLGRIVGLTGAGARALTGTLAQKLLGEAAFETLTTKVLRSSATKWIAFVLRAGVVGAEFGTISMLDLLATDLFKMTKCKTGFSSSAEYWSRFKTGMVIGAGMELIAIPVLAPLANALKSKASTVLEAAGVLRESGKSFGEITKILLQGSEELDKALGRALDNPEVTEPLARGFRQKMRDVLRTYAREYQSRAYSSLAQFLDRELSAAATKGLRRLLESVPESDIDQLLASIARGGEARAGRVLELLGTLDANALRALADSGALARLGEAPALLDLLGRNAPAGWKLLGDVFGNSVADCEAYLKQFDEIAQRDSATAILLRKGNALPRDLVADLVKKHGPLPANQIAVLDQLVASKVRVSAFTEGTGPTLPEFSENFAKLTPGEQALALRRNPGRTPQAVLDDAQRTREIFKARAADIEPPRAELEAQIKAGERGAIRQRVKAALREPSGKYQTAIPKSALLKNQKAYAELQSELESFAPDAIVGLERGGPLVADAATQGSPALARTARVNIPKQDLNPAMDAMVDEVEQLIAKGQKKFAFTDVQVSGSVANKIQKDVLDKLAQAHPDCEFRGIWLRERLGYETGISATGDPILRSPMTSKFPNVKHVEVDVPYIVGEDSALSSAANAEPVYIFDESGAVIDMVKPAEGESTRDLLLRLLRTWKG